MAQNNEIFSQLQARISQQIRWISVAFVFVWASLSILLVRQVVIEREALFRLAVTSHQEDLVSGNWRTFLEASDQFFKMGVSDVQLCWSSTEQICLHDKAKSFGWKYDLSIPVGRPMPVLLVNAKISILSPMLFALGALVLAIICISMLRNTILSMGRQFQAAQNQIKDAVRIAIESGEYSKDTNLPSEISPLADALIDKIEIIRAKEKANARLATIVDISRQVAHDIRSPVSALNLIAQSPSIKNLPEADLVKSISSRIQSIAADLVNTSLRTARPNEVVFADDVIREISAEILLQKPKSTFDVKLARLPLPSGVPAVAFGRAISNLIQNAVDATSDGGAVLVTLGSSENELQVGIEDTGKGIPAELTSVLGYQQVTFGKTDGVGLGLWSSRTFVEGLGGKLNLSSRLGHGTNVTIHLPLDNSPNEI